MARTTKDVSIYENTKTIVFPDGEVISSVSEQRVRKADEPSFVKVYLDVVLTVTDLSKSLNPILLAFLKHMSYADRSQDDGGQVIYMNSALKKDIAKDLGVGVDRINQSITQFVKSGIFKRLDVSKYQVNPDYFGRGDWMDIKAIKGNFSFSSEGISIVSEVVSEIN